MNEDVKVKFIDALLSGDYNQIGGRLRTSEGVCANGVLCELAMLNGVHLRYGRDGYGYLSPSTAEDYDTVIDGRFWDYVTTAPPRSVLVWAGIDEYWADSLAHLNDGPNATLGGLSFEDIAERVKNDTVEGDDE